MSRKLNSLINIKHKLNLLTGWRRWAVLSILGVMAALALPPLYLLPFLIPAFSGLLWAIEDNHCSGFSLAAFADGWWFGFGFSIAGLYWIGFSFLVDTPQYGFLAPFAVLAIAGGMAFFPALVALFSSWVFNQCRLSAFGRVLVFSALWTAVEWSREWLLTGFPWNAIGTVWVFSESIIQLASVTGVYGLSLLAVIAASIPTVLAGPLGRRPPVVFVFLIIFLIWLAGVGRLSQASEEVVSGVHLRLVQPNIPQAMKWKSELRRSHVLKQLAMSKMVTDSKHHPTHVIWSETAVPYIIEITPGLSKTLVLCARSDGLVLTGAPRSSSL